MPPIRNLILVLGDQLTPEITSLATGDPARDLVLMAELDDEARSVRHHKKKIAFLFSAMRHFAGELRGRGWTVEYVTLEAGHNRGSFTAQLGDSIARHRPQRVVVTEAGEWRVRQMQASWSERFGLPVDILPGPAGGRWNFDAENRKPAKADLFLPRPPSFEPDAVTQEVLALVEARFGGHFGDRAPFGFAVTRADAEAAFDSFVARALPKFGDYQDAMRTGEPFLHHAVIAQYLNCGLLDPLRVCRRVEIEWRAGRVPLNAAEGFIRQVIGWREYVRGIYWLKMPGYARANFLGHTRALPGFYWTGETAMACVRAAVT
ncbi:MAG: cryptochrome/photolyase family protein, partial [Pseudomonadales bacterium 32-61-5]